MGLPGCVYVVVRGRPEVIEVFPCCERGLGLPPLEALAPGRGGGAVLTTGASSSRPAPEAGAGGHGRYGAEKAGTTEKKCDRRLLLQKKSE